MSRGLSVHVFKNALVSQPAPPPPAPKYDPAQARPPASNGGAPWNRQLSYQASRNGEQDRKQAPVALSQDRRLVQVPQPASQPWPVDTKYGKSQSKGYLIHPSPELDMYIYERSILSTDDGLSSSPSSDESSDLELFPDNSLAMSRLEISSTRASSSTETLEATLHNTSRNAITGGGGAVPSLSQTRPPLAITAPPPPPPYPTSTRPPPEQSIPVIPVRPTLTRTESSYRPRKTSISHPVYPIQFSSADARSDSDDSTLLNENPGDMVVDMYGASNSNWGMSSSVAHSARSTTPFRRDSDSRAPSSSAPPPRARRESLDTQMRPPAPPQGRMEDPSYPRAPPGLYAVATPPDTDNQRSGPGQSPQRGAAVPAPAGTSSAPGPSNANTSSSRAQQQQVQMQMSKSSSGSPTQPPRTTPSVRAPEALVRSDTLTGAGPSSSPPRSSPPRRDSQSSTTQPSPVLAEGVVVIAASKRSVRWTENLVCPSPVPPEQRRKGWFNRRGDQLWTNDGQFKMPEPGQEYPLDLAHYPEPSTGWMNEEGVRIDMQHRLVPKRPLRSALKQPKNTVNTV
ncbi:uncharacterized protein TRAVEDRAFT_54361 [Trametes versicolor FP-101664 SS1]|uniref:Uncharacterized protein n=1 Tax=Trametes versicolor (strain FP-101664) TaxID=717944 RepID=R7S6T6_TRAVS|nr:uncharacterized protein TRAVEDRAFT_54361 [Trametes versicolor FP-101664 SS1]EIW51606.1 hypothetical protein TRAVEDRAFT_54361 [Trametes versicolor FP-101664 SS1]